ncbi:amino acid permease [Candidatus Arthromitus sp. SFB-rat-Yit]|nr:amino acid permease [Candidatus Arthromitus sp. SFB-rat-Yit]BAK80708.1 amino acid permease [Candidatus Arthromitus sp. SFB-rat-Yit]
MNNRKQISKIALLLMTFSAIFNFSNIINNSIQIGLANISGYLFSTIVYFIPITFMVAEFVSINKESESGIHSWIKTSLGDKWAFLGAWSYFFANLFYFTSLIPNTLIYASYTFFGRNLFEGNSKSTLVLAISSVVLFWIGTYISIRGVKVLSKVTNIAGVAKMLMGILFIILAFVFVFAMKKPPAQEFTVETLTPKFDWTFFMVMAWILQSLGGSESTGVYVKDTKGGIKSFIKTIITAVILVGGIYTLACVAIGLVVPREVLENNYSNGIFNVFSILGGHFGISNIIMNRFIGLILLLSNLGSLVIWTSVPVKALFSEIPEGVFGTWVAKTDELGTPYNALKAQAIIVTILLLIPGIGIGSLESFLETVINMTAATYLIPILFLLIAYIVLRLKKNNIDREFKMGNRGFGIFMGIILFFILIFVIFMSIFPEPSLIIDAMNGIIPDGEGNPILICAYKVLGLFIFIWFALICWGRHSKNKFNKGKN